MFYRGSDSLEEAIAGRIDDNQEISIPSKARRGEKILTASAQMTIKAALCIAMLEGNISKSELARRLNVDVSVVRRMLNPYHATRLSSMQQALAALGKKIELRIS